MKQKRSKQTGFTIVELLIVIVVIGIVAAITIVAYNGIQERARVARISTDLRNIKNALSQYYLDNSAWPCFDHTYADATEIAWSAPYIKWPRTPMGDIYHWEHNISGLAYTISIPSLGTSTASTLDKVLDDGNLATGVVRGDGGRLEYAGMDQSINSHCGS